MNKDTVISFAAGSCYSYIITNDNEALLVDPHITLVDKYIKTLAKKNLKLTGIIDTHTHADHVSSASLLKKKYNVPVYMSEHSVSDVADKRLKDGDQLKLGQTNVKVLSTPGHTDDSISLLTEDGNVFTGDVLLINSVGRTDFQNGSPEDMFDSLQKLASLPEQTTLRPAHDYKQNKTSTIAEQKSSNPFLLEKDKDQFCKNARSKSLPKPANMDTIIVANQKGSAGNYSIISAKDAFEKLQRANHILLDVRNAQELAEISVDLENVKHIPLQSLGSSMDSISNQDSYYVLCRSGHRATIAAMSLIQNGFSNISVIEGGLIAWEKAKLPVKKTPGPIALERQVRMIAGSLVLIGALLSIISKWFLIIPIWVGCGLLYAGISNNCMMGILLMKLPYNQKALKKDAGTCSMDGGGCSM